MPEHGDLTDVCKDGNLLKVNSCNCAAETWWTKRGCQPRFHHGQMKKKNIKEKERQKKRKEKNDIALQRDG